MVESDLPVDERLPVVDFLVPPVVRPVEESEDFFPVVERLPEVRLLLAEVGGVRETQVVSLNTINPRDSVVRRVMELFPNLRRTRSSVMLTR